MGYSVTVGESLLQCCKGSFKLNKWVSNNRTLLLSIPENSRSKEMKDLDFDQDVLPVERALGRQWCTETDSSEFKINIQEKPLTRRGILSMVSSIYDLLGMLAPVILPAKQILQKLTGMRFGWDARIPKELEEQWVRWSYDFHLLKDYKVKKRFMPCNFGQPVSAQLHHFEDASESGYGTVSYLRLMNKAHTVHCSFIMAKARVVPLKPVTIPRLELTAATVAVRIDRMMQDQLELPLEPSVFWTDSTSVLKYVLNETSRFQTFVANRLTVCQEVCLQVTF